MVVIICQECGMKLNANEGHNLKNCAYHHLGRAYILLGKENCIKWLNKQREGSLADYYP